MQEKLLEISEIERLMAPALDGGQMMRLHAVLSHCLIDEGDFPSAEGRYQDNEHAIEAFLSAKTIEGCSPRTLAYYGSTLRRFSDAVAKSFASMSTDDVRGYLFSCQSANGVSNVTVDNVRRIISSLFSWLEAEDLIYKSPARRIKKIRATKDVKPIISDESMETLRDGCCNVRDLAIIDLLSSTGMRVGELVKLDRADIDFEGRECIVHGKGSKERKVYFDARAKVHLRDYLTMRNDGNPALFVSLNAPHDRLEISGVEAMLRKLGREKLGQRIHPHKFRRTLATRAIDKGMPIEQVQVLLGHSKIDTTLCYAMVDQQNVKQSHHKYIG
ncbi:tyrosine-type recombinase/integrase [Berryella wangjianweii]|uniref:Tyrosine-type recombinase/integrase n=1 Tax=Berryella wangjianweii TaxID=2734634 RepID=A0A6M8J7J4_9ACTN|nr:site-specific tyrosine recombinase/integron integrase [Berryella wangjianweii]QKF07548.1 tyrosine-type recombinase/integrase [Berryella wangjianweii]